MISIENDGPLLRATNYWTTEHAAAGLLFASWNAGALRLLVPDAALLDKMRTGRHCLLSYRQGMLQIVFDDDTDTPYSVAVDNRQSDRLIRVVYLVKPVHVLAYTAEGLQAEWPGQWE